MKKSVLWLYALCIISFCSCVTGIQLQEGEPPVRLTSPSGESRMEFIGYKIDTNTLPTASSAKTSVGLWAREIDIVPSEFDLAKILTSAPALKQLGFALANSGIATNLILILAYTRCRKLSCIKATKGTFLLSRLKKVSLTTKKINLVNIFGVESAPGFYLVGFPLQCSGLQWKTASIHMI